MPWFEILGWLGVLTTLSAYSRRNMQGLRTMAVTSNLLFITYGSLAQVYPMLSMHLLLLPLNTYRLVEILRAKRRLRATRRGKDPLDALGPILKPACFTDGDVLFQRGEEADKVYYLVEGTVELPEVGVTLNAPTLLGEMAYFARDRQRTTTAVCRGDARIAEIDEVAFMRIYNTHPEFGVYVIRLMAQRLIEGSRTRPELYRSFASE